MDKMSYTIIQIGTKCRLQANSLDGILSANKTKASSYGKEGVFSFKRRSEEENSMKKFNRKLVTGAITIALAASAMGCGKTAGTASATAASDNVSSETAAETTTVETEESGDVVSTMDEIKIAMVNPLSGDLALYGLDQQRAMSLAFEEINAAGGVGGAQIVMDCYDDLGDPQNAAKGAQKYADDDSYLAIVGSSTSSAVLAMIPIIDDGEIVEMICSGSSPSLSGTSDYFFRFAAQDVQVGKMIGKGITDRGYKNAVVLYPNNDYGVNLSENLNAYLEENGVEILSSIDYNPSDQDFTAIITTIKGLNPEAIALCGTVTDSSLLISQIKQQGIESFLMGGTSIYNSNAIEIAGDALEGVGCVSVYISTNPDAQVQEFVKKYEEKFGETPDAYSAMGYDMAYAFADACERAMAANGGEVTRETLRDAMETIDYDGVTGDITFNETHDWVRDYIMLEFKDGEFVLSE